MSYITIQLDTTEPTLNIYAPSYVTIDMQVDILIESDERLDDWQEIYVIDQDGKRHDYTFKITNNRITGVINTNTYPVGLATLYVTVRDEVHNVSRQHEKVITVRETFQSLELEINDSALQLDIYDGNLKMDIKDSDVNEQFTS